MDWIAYIKHDSPSIMGLCKSNPKSPKTIHNIIVGKIINIIKLRMQKKQYNYEILKKCKDCINTIYLNQCLSKMPTQHELDLIEKQVIRMAFTDYSIDETNKQLSREIKEEQLYWERKRNYKPTSYHPNTPNSISTGSHSSHVIIC